MSPGNIDNVAAPKSMIDIVQEVTEYVIKHSDAAIAILPFEFEPYDAALHAVWPELYKTSPKAHLMVAISIYVEIAERWSFEIPPDIRKLVI